MASKDMQKLIAKGIRENILINFQVEGGTAQDAEGMEVLIKDYQLDRIKDRIIHMDFFKITRGEKIATKVPVKYTGIAKGVKNGGIQEVFSEEVDIECLPKHLPEDIQVDVSALDIHDFIKVKDLPLIENVTYTLNPETILLSIGIAKVQVTEEKPVEAAEVAEEKPEGEGKKKEEK
jgi:large subunit ribosomal protein L25